MCDKISAIKNNIYAPLVIRGERMGKNLKGKELGKGITQRKNGVYHGRYVDRFGARRSVYGTTVKEVKAKLAEAELNEQKLSNIELMKK